MSKEFADFCTVMSEKIHESYDPGITLDQAEKLAGEFLTAQLLTAHELHVVDLDARMRKTGLKAIKSAVRTNEVKKYDKKPTEGHLEDVVNLDEIVQGEQKSLDEAEAKRDRYQNFFNIFKDAHIFFRGVSKGRFE